MGTHQCISASVVPATCSEVSEELSTVDALQDKVYAVVVLEKPQGLDDELAINNFQNIPLCPQMRDLQAQGQCQCI